MAYVQRFKAVVAIGVNRVARSHPKGFLFGGVKRGLVRKGGGRKTSTLDGAIAVRTLFLLQRYFGQGSRSKRGGREVQPVHQTGT